MRSSYWAEEVQFSDLEKTPIPIKPCWAWSRRDACGKRINPSLEPIFFLPFERKHQQPTHRLTAIHGRSTMFTVSAGPFILDHTPSRSSPLVARDLNVCPRPPPFFPPQMTWPAPGEIKTQAKRRTSFDPRSQRKDTETARRRNLFLRKVKQNRDDRRWESRGEQVRGPWTGDGCIWTDKSGTDAET